MYIKKYKNIVGKKIIKKLKTFYKISIREFQFSKFHLTVTQKKIIHDTRQTTSKKKKMTIFPR